jgi:hypothetical protein
MCTNLGIKIAMRDLISGSSTEECYLSHQVEVHLKREMFRDQ